MVKFCMAKDTNIAEIVATKTPCWACKAEAEANAHFCPACGRVQPSLPTDHFRFFGLERKLNVNTAALEREFYRLSRKLHPDVYARASADEQQWSLEKSSQLNDSYRILKEPIVRTQYLLGLEGIKLEEQSSAATIAARESGTEKIQVVPPELLEEVFELNMQLQEMRAHKEMGESGPGIAHGLLAAKDRFEGMLNHSTEELKQLWDRWDAALSTEAETAKALAKEEMAGLLNRRSYVRNLVRDVNEALGN